MHFIELEVMISRGLGAAVQCCDSHTTPVTAPCLYSHSSGTEGMIAKPLVSICWDTISKESKLIPFLYPHCNNEE